MTKQMTEIRQATPDDAADILVFWQLSGARPSADTVDSLRLVAAHPYAVVLLAIDTGQIIGSLIVAFDGWRGNLYRLVVHPKKRREGIARELMSRAEAILSAWGARRADTVVDLDNVASLALCRSLGYVMDEVGRRHRKSI